MIPIGSLSVHPAPPADRVIAVLKGYFDESGDGKDAKETSVSLAGYVARLEAWQRFEPAWRAVLAEFHLPYLHMADLKSRTGPYASWADEDESVVDERETRLFTKLVGVVKEAGLSYCCGHTVVTRDLRRFNQEHGLNIDAKSFVLAQCMKWVCVKFPQEQTEMILDRMTKPEVTVAAAWQYLRSDHHYWRITQEPTVSPLPERGKECSQTLFPLQLADFLAWEVRKDYELKRRRFESDNPRGPSREFHAKLREDFYAAKRQRALKTGRPLIIGLGVDPMRGSMTALCDALEPDGALWRYNDLCEMHAARNGKWAA